MRFPTRKSETDRRALAEEPDRYLTPDAIERLKRTRERLEKIERPAAKLELQRAQEMGDLSENFGYQEAKRRLRGINDRLMSLDERLARAIPIEAGSDDGAVKIGSTVTLETPSGSPPSTSLRTGLAGGEASPRRFVFTILGSQETDPTRGRISYRSPLGAALLGKRAGDTATVEGNGRTVTYAILDVT